LAFFIPIKIEGGKKQLNEGEENPTDIIGGPGWALIQPGNFGDIQAPCVDLRGPASPGLISCRLLKPSVKLPALG